MHKIYLEQYMGHIWRTQDKWTVANSRKRALWEMEGRGKKWENFFISLNFCIFGALLFYFFLLWVFVHAILNNVKRSHQQSLLYYLGFYIVAVFRFGTSFLFLIKWYYVAFADSGSYRGAVGLEVIKRLQGSPREDCTSVVDRRGRAPSRFEPLLGCAGHEMGIC